MTTCVSVMNEHHAKANVKGEADGSSSSSSSTRRQSKRPARAAASKAKKQPAGIVAKLPTNENYFPFKLYDMLAYVEEEGLESIVSWLPNGNSFVISDPNGLVAIVQHFFGQTKFRSFLRQLNMWSFERLPGSSASKGRYFRHPYFIKGRRELIHKMRRNMFKPPPPSGEPTAKSSPPDVSTVAAVAHSDSHLEGVPAGPHNLGLSFAEQPFATRISTDEEESPGRGGNITPSRMLLGHQPFDTPLSSSYSPQNVQGQSHRPVASFHYPPSASPPSGRAAGHTSKRGRRRTSLTPPSDGERIKFEGKSFFFLDTSEHDDKKSPK